MRSHAGVTVAAGRVTFRVTNAGTTEHEFEIVQGGTAIGEVEGLVPGLTGTLTVDLKPGAYTFQCLIAAHDKLGMTGTLTVK
ncbi:MAG: cupredoxin domain-containing protein [Chloroflexota bacterium]